jgi:hypothetical protein
MLANAMTRKKWIILLVFLALIGLYAKFRSPGNAAETSPAPTDAGLQTRRYEIKGDLAAARREVEQIIPALTTYGKSWRLATGNGNPKAAFSDAESPALAIIRAEVPVVMFTDDLQVRLRQYAPARIAVDVKSASRVGKSDFGENRRHIKQLLAALDQRFANAAP